MFALYDFEYLLRGNALIRFDVIFEFQVIGGRIGARGQLLTAILSLGIMDSKHTVLSVDFDGGGV